MEFLKDVLGEELYNTFSSKLNEYNGNPDNAEKTVKLANLSGGDYVAKGKYESMVNERNGEIKKLEAANALIESLQKAKKQDEDVQKSVTEYKNQVEQMQAQLTAERLDNAVRLALMSANAVDTDYLIYKVKANGTSLELGEDGTIKGWSDTLKALKNQCPSMFRGADEGTGQFRGFKPIQQPEEGQPGGSALSKADILKMPYAKQVEFFEKNPDAFREMMK